MALQVMARRKVTGAHGTGLRPAKRAAPGPALGTRAASIGPHNKRCCERFKAFVCTTAGVTRASAFYLC